MSLLQQISDDMKQAMKAKDKETLSVIRMLKASLQNEGIKVNRELTPDEELTILAREMKQRKDSKEEFANAGRQDLADDLAKEITIVERYLPQQLTEEEVRSIVAAAISATGATGKSDFGKVMGKVMPQVKGKADGKLVNAVVKELLN
ncbi:GatB/YqeY domain-containing protein [Enterococcus nangangensis]|uniref:GatB/YqeY domain-containing protein n=1 Tax=Enterococcus nangangensis TaxID=2559926 RepID=UPI0010FA4C39|nr:GatB/YqeY domain-containing protein [Enterococcus nangangensis]